MPVSCLHYPKTPDCTHTDPRRPFKLDEEVGPYLFKTHISGYSADDAAKKVHGFIMNVDPTGDGATPPDAFEITYTYGDHYELTADEKTVCTFPL